MGEMVNTGVEEIMISQIAALREQMNSTFASS